MSSPSALELSKAINREARHHYPKVAKQLGASSLLATALPRLALRRETPYPYSFTEDDTMLPSNHEAFGRIIRRDRKSGLVEIHESISQQREEHQWLYVPGAELWVDTTTAAHKAEVDSDQYAHIFLSHMFPEIEAVHTHPDHTVSRLAEDFPWDYSENYLLEAARPSTPDLMRHFQMTRRTAPDSRQVSSIVSHYGVTSFSLNDVGGQSESFQTSQYDHLIIDTSAPIDAIRMALDKRREHATNFEGEPVLDFTFEPLYQ